MTPESNGGYVPDRGRCSMTQIGDREWWCVTHRRGAEECDAHLPRGCRCSTCWEDARLESLS